jgi:hypothetical protein
MIRYPDLHGWSDAQRLMDAPEVVKHVVKRHGASVILNLLREF